MEIYNSRIVNFTKSLKKTKLREFKHAKIAVSTVTLFLLPNSGFMCPVNYWRWIAVGPLLVSQPVQPSVILRATLALVEG